MPNRRELANDYPYVVKTYKLSDHELNEIHKSLDMIAYVRDNVSDAMYGLIERIATEQEKAWAVVRGLVGYERHENDDQTIMIQFAAKEIQIRSKIPVEEPGGESGTGV